jgi:predicted secreted Zn-dependent protease
MPLFPALAGVAWLLAAGTAVGHAEVRSSLRHAVYEVGGESLPAVWWAIGSKAPQVLRNAAWQAETRIRYRWDVHYAASARGCAARRPVVDVAVTIVLPDWPAASSAPPAAQAAWRQYVSELRRHEEEHRQIALETAGKLDSLLRNAPRDLPCDTLARTIDRAAARILAEERRRQNDRDRFAAPVRLF